MKFLDDAATAAKGLLGAVPSGGSAQNVLEAGSKQTEELSSARGSFLSGGAPKLTSSTPSGSPSKAPETPTKAPEPEKPPAESQVPKNKQKKASDESFSSAKNEKDDPPLKNKEDVQNKMKQWIKENPGKAIAAAAGTAAGAAAIAYAADSYLSVNGKELEIKKIEAHTEGGILGIGGTNIAKITYEPSTDILAPDFITITDSDSKPSIDGTDLEIYKVQSKTQVWIKVDKKLTKDGKSGKITVKTTPTARLGDAVGAGIGSVASAAGTAASGASEGLLSGLDGFLGGLGLPTGILGYSIIAIVIFLVIFILVKLF